MPKIIEFEPLKILNQTSLLFSDPKNCWGKLQAEYVSDKDFILNYIAILGILPPLATFILNTIIGLPGPLPITPLKTPLFEGLFALIIHYALGLLIFFLLAICVEKLAPYFKGSSPHTVALRFVGYTWVPTCLSSIFLIFPALGFLSYLGPIYGIYLLWHGANRMAGVPNDHRPMFVGLVTILIIIFVILEMQILSPFSPRLTLTGS